MKRNNFMIAGERNKDGSIKGAVTGKIYQVGDVVDNQDIKTTIEDGVRKTVFKTAEDTE